MSDQLPTCGCLCGCANRLSAAGATRLCPACDGANGTAAVLLAESPSTGYIWRCDPPAGVTLVAEHYLIADPAREWVGGTGRHLFVLSGTPGTSVDISWSLLRPWESEPVQQLVTPVLFEEHAEL